MKKILPLFILVLILSGCTQIKPSPEPITDPENYNSVDLLANEQLNNFDTAETILRADPEIAKWLALFTGPEKLSKNNGRAAILQGDVRENGEFEFKLYESLPGHNATYGWYCVDIDSKVVRECALD